MNVSTHSGVAVYTVAGTSTARELPEWLIRKRKRSLKKDPEFANRVELLQDFEFPEASSCIRASEDGRVRLIDPVVYEVLGADPLTVDILQAKSHVSYRAGFDRVAPRSIVADTLGPSAADLRKLRYFRRPRPMFPFEAFPEDGGAPLRVASPTSQR